MRLASPVSAVLALALLFPLTVLAQPAQSTPSISVPRLIKFSGVFEPTDGQPPQRVELVTVSIYADETGGVPLWQEVQNVTVDPAGRYTLLLGGTRAEGMPPELFASGEARWLAMQWGRPGEVERARTRLTSVPYALRASDADTLGGKPASAYMLAAPDRDETAVSKQSTDKQTQAVTAALVNSGTTNVLAKYVTPTALGNSALFEAGGRVGINSTAPLDALHVRFTNTTGQFAGYAVQNLGSTSTSYSGMLFYDHTGAASLFQGFNNVTKEYRINNIAKAGAVKAGSINFMIDGNSYFRVRTDGDIDIPLSIRKNGDLFLHTIGSANTALGLNALNPLVSGSANTAIGYRALASITGDRGENTGVGAYALTNTTGEIVADGRDGSENTSVGVSSMFSNTSGFENTALGAGALYYNSTGDSNVAIGFQALNANDSGDSNTAVGWWSLYVTRGSNNTGVGNLALDNLTSGDENIAIGVNAGENLTSGSGNLYLGALGGTFGPENNATYIRNVSGRTASGGVAVFVNSAGKLGTLTSSARAKEDVAPIGDVSAALDALRPVSFYYKPEFDDGSRLKQYGLIAEEVAAVLPDLVVRNPDGTVETVRYHFLVPLLLAEVQRLEKEREVMAHELAELKALVESVARR